MAATVDEVVGALDPDPDRFADVADVRAGLATTGAGETVVRATAVTAGADAADDAAVEDGAAVDASATPAPNGSRAGPVGPVCRRVAAALVAPASAAAVGP